MAMKQLMELHLSMFLHHHLVNIYSKLGCFCFEKQALKAGEKATYIMTFYLDPEMVNDPNTKNIKDVTMSYTFFSSDYYNQSKL